MKSFVKKLQKGLTLIEAAMVLAISALVISGILMFYANANESRAIKRTSEDIIQIIGIMNRLSETSTNFRDIGEVTSAINAITSSSTSQGPNPFKNPYIVSPINPIGTNGVVNTYQISVKIPKNVCGRVGSLTIPSISRKLNSLRISEKYIKKENKYQIASISISIVVTSGVSATGSGVTIALDGNENSSQVLSEILSACNTAPNGSVDMMFNVRF